MNPYDNPDFFEKYSQTIRSKYGLDATPDWEHFRKILPNLKDKRVLDLGCGYGWHCLYAAENGASKVLGLDLSVKMLEVAETKKNSPVITYSNQNMAEVDFPEDSFDLVISSLAIHYLEDFDNIVARIKKLLVNKGDFVFSVENPIFTAYGTGQKYFNEEGEMLDWPIDNYHNEGLRNTNFLNADIVKYHKTMSTYINTLIRHGFKINEIVEPPIGDKSNVAKRLSMILLVSASL